MKNLASTLSRVTADEFTALLEPVLPRLRGQIAKLCQGGYRPEPDDVLQSTLEKAWTHRDQFRTGTNFPAWIHRIAHNTFITEYRKRRLVSFAAIGEGDGGEVPEPAFLLPSTERALLGLGLFGEVVRLVDLHDFKYREVAEDLGVPLGTVMSRVHRGRVALREALEQPS